MTEKVDKKSEFGFRFSEIRSYFCENSNKKFAEMVGIPEKQSSNYCGGSKVPGKKILDKVLEAFPEVSRVWLLLGEGSMLNQQSAPSINTINQTGDNTQNNSVTSEDVSKLIEAVSSQQKTIQTLVEMLNNK